MGSEGRRSLPRAALLHAGIIALLVVYSAPVIGVVLTAVQSNAEISLNGVWHVPQQPTLDSFVEVLTESPAARFLLNTVLVTVPATALSVVGGLLLGYVFSQFRFPAAELLFIVVIAGMFFPPQSVLIPVFEMTNTLGIYDTLIPLIIVHVAFGLPICTLLMRNFLAALPSGLREAAIVDGAGEWSVLGRVILPLSLPAIAVLATLQFTWIWNDFLWPLILTRSDEARTIMAGIISLQGQYSVAWSAQAAAAILASIPTVVIFIAFQRYFIRGLTMGAVKE
jgi:ABC-type glycerol-3-phosphate transport system permease component